MKAIFFIAVLIIHQIAFAQLISKSAIKTTFSKNGDKKVIYSTSFFKDNFLLEENNSIYYYYSNGNLKECYSQTLGDFETGMHIIYYPNAQIKEVYNTLFSQRIGTFLSFHSNGKQKTIGQYKKIECKNEINIQNDTSNIYNEKTKEIIGIKYSSNIVSIKIGTWFYYKTNGKLIKQENFDKIDKNMTN